MLINAAKLTKELEAAGIPVFGASSDGRIDFKPEATAEQRSQAEAIRAAHDATDTDALKRQMALTYLQGVNFAARKAFIEGLSASAVSTGVRTALKAMNRTEWALAVLVLGLVADDPGE